MKNPSEKILDNYIYITSGEEFNLGSGATCKVKKIATKFIDSETDQEV